MHDCVFRRTELKLCKCFTASFNRQTELALTPQCIRLNVSDQASSCDHLLCCSTVKASDRVSGRTVGASEQGLGPYIPTLAVTSPSNYGNIDAENESNFQILSSVESPRAARDRPLKSAPRQGGGNPRKRARSSAEGSMAEERPGGNKATNESLLCKLPPELIDAVLEILEPLELVPVSATCRLLRKHAISDVHWQRHVQDNVPVVTVTSPSPMKSFHELYALHHQLWFLPKYKIWFCDLERTGRLIIARFNPAKASIEAYQLVVACTSKTYQQWAADPPVVIHKFEATTGLHKARPILFFAPGCGHNASNYKRSAKANPFFNEIPIPLDDRSEGIHNCLSRARALDDETVQGSLQTQFPYHNIWPPPTIPARDYIQSYSFDLPSESRPTCRAEASDQTFRIRRWMEMSGAIGIHMGEDISSYSTLDPKLYTPTETKPWRGIWAGDYSGHGFEFLLIHQPDDPPSTDAELGLVKLEDETDDEWEKRRLETRVFRGRLEAIKLTGDPNVPRGEYTFVADDLGPDGYVGLVHDAPLMGGDPRGTRVVRSKGHVALTGFVEDMFIESQLMLISHDRLAQYWVEFGHISYFQRVDIDKLLLD
ncbi:hypothetical protein NLU13_7596 [Sarocladium strictum]|uniref:F-box domain-containing protein n=1 Tax=Sarocladium strictum TaxID=5046 RepID=A0AA39GD31_SARSR|nr:hypothetical protein NLU13_7596 [Sarocladium strictum]